MPFKEGEIAQALQNSDQIGLNFDGLVYNAYEKPKGYYGYYQYYGDYAYQYYAENIYQTVMIMKMNNNLLPIFYYQFHLVPYLLG